MTTSSGVRPRSSSRPRGGYGGGRRRRADGTPAKPFLASRVRSLRALEAGQPSSGRGEGGIVSRVRANGWNAAVARRGRNRSAAAFLSISRWQGKRIVCSSTRAPRVSRRESACRRCDPERPSPSGREEGGPSRSSSQRCHRPVELSPSCYPQRARPRAKIPQGRQSAGAPARSVGEKISRRDISRGDQTTERDG